MPRRVHTRHLVLGGATLVGVATAAVSFASLYDLARLCGIPEGLAAALPIALDAGAAVATLVWITERGELRKWGAGIAITALLGTLAGNALSHAVAGELLFVNAAGKVDNLWLVLAVGAVIPAMLAAVVHLAALMARGDRVEESAESVKSARKSARPATPPAAPAPKVESTALKPVLHAVPADPAHPARTVDRVPADAAPPARVPRGAQRGVKFATAVAFVKERGVDVVDWRQVASAADVSRAVAYDAIKAVREGVA